MLHLIPVAHASLATLPSSTDFMASIGSWSSPFFSDLLPFAEYAIGILLGAAIIVFLLLGVIMAVRALIHH